MAIFDRENYFKLCMWPLLKISTVIFVFWGVKCECWTFSFYFLFVFVSICTELCMCLGGMSIATQLNKSSWKIWGPLKGPKAGWNMAGYWGGCCCCRGCWEVEGVAGDAMKTCGVLTSVTPVMSDKLKNPDRLWRLLSSCQNPNCNRA